MTSFERDGLKLWFSEDGSGPPVILHTGGAGDSDMFVQAGYVGALVNAGFRVVCFDHRGHGRSDKPSRGEQHRTQEYVEDLVALLDTLQLPRAAIVGYSQGMHIALAFAAQYPVRAASVVGIGAVGAADDPADWRRPAAASVRERGMAASMQAMAAAEDPPAPEWLLENLASTDSEVFAQLLEAVLDDEETLWEQLPNVHAPTLLVVGAREEDEGDAQSNLAARNARAAARVLPQGETHVVPELRHLAIFWRSELTLPVILRFLQDNYPPTRASSNHQSLH